jgi:probable blue pigment (indigoidine) exporter
MSSIATLAPPPHGSTGARRALVLTTALAPAAWGTTYLVTTELLPPDRPLLAGVLRALPAGLALAAVTRQRPVGAWWGRALVLGTLNIGGFFALLFVAAYRLPGGVAATLGAVQPLIAAGLAAVLLHERLRSQVVVAGLVGVVGVGLLVLRAGAQLDGVGIAAGFAGATSMASGVVLTKRWGRPVPLLTFTTWQLVAGGLVLLPVALVAEGAPPALSATNVAGYLWLGTVGTGLAYALWFRGIERLPVGQVSLLGLVSPIVATIAGWLVVGQHLAAPQLLGMVLVLGAMALGQRPAAAAASAEGVAANTLLGGGHRLQLPLERQLGPGLPAAARPARAAFAGAATLRERSAAVGRGYAGGRSAVTRPGGASWQTCGRTERRRRGPWTSRASTWRRPTATSARSTKRATRPAPATSWSTRGSGSSTRSGCSPPVW